MKKYSEQLINKYIMGFEIENIEELENSRSFMMQVIDKSGDYRLYNLCSDRLKKNYDFIKYLVLKFSNNIDFICNISDYYLNSTEDEFSRVELVSIMTNLTKVNKEKYMHYCMFGHSLYYYKRLQIETAKRTLKEDEFTEEIGMGFLLIFEEYNHSKIVLDFYAKKIILGIFDEFDIDLEYMLHEQFPSVDKLKETGLNNYIINFVSSYDSMLSSYLCTNIELMDDIKNRISKIIDNWERFEAKNEYDKYNLLFDKVHEYLSDKDALIDETSYLYYVGRKLGIADKILAYDTFYDTLPEVFNFVDETFIKECLEMSFEERIHLRSITNIMKEVIFSKNNKELMNKDKILKLDFKQKRDNN